jgi:hypothetical protein
MPTPAESSFPGGMTTSGIGGRRLSSPRTLASWVLVTYVALYLFFEFFRWVLPRGTFTDRSATAGFHTLVVIVMPVLAVLLAANVTPVIPRARLVAAIALIEYVIALFLGFVTLLTGLGGVFDAVRTASDGFSALRYLVMGMADLTLMGVAAAVALHAYTALGGKIPYASSTT